MITILHLLHFCTYYLRSILQKINKFSYVSFAASHIVLSPPSPSVYRNTRQEYQSYSIFDSPVLAPQMYPPYLSLPQRYNRTTVK